MILNALNNLIKSNALDLGPAFIEYMHTGLKLEKQGVIKFEASTGSFVSECTSLPSLARQYADSCNKTLPLEDIGHPIKTALTELLHNAAQNYFERMLLKAPGNFKYAQAQTICKFQGIAYFTFNNQGNHISIVHLSYDPKQVNPSTYLARIKQQLNNNNRFFLSRWFYDSDTTRFIEDRLKNAGGLRTAHNTLLCPLTGKSPLSFANPTMIRQQAVARLAQVFSPNITETPPSPSSTSLSSESCQSSNDSFRSDHCLPVFPELTLTARAGM